MFKFIKLFFNFNKRLSQLEQREKINDAAFCWLVDKITYFEQKEAEESIKDESIELFNKNLIRKSFNN